MAAEFTITVGFRHIRLGGKGIGYSYKIENPTEYLKAYRETFGRGRLLMTWQMPKSEGDALDGGATGTASAAEVLEHWWPATANQPRPSVKFHLREPLHVENSPFEYVTEDSEAED